ncbi:MAG TPA: hypothetical protein PK765_04115 [bacterium]|nr:hypothetical protein [bacterium]
MDPDYPHGRPTALRDAYKICSRLVANGVFVRVRSGVFFVVDGSSARIVDIVDRNYWSIVRKIVGQEVGREYVVGGSAAAALHLRDYAPVETLVIHTRDTNKTVRIADGFTLKFRTAVGGSRSGGRTIFPALSSGAVTVRIDGVAIRTLSEEAAILDCLLEKSPEARKIAARFVKKYHGYLDRGRLGALVRLRYITALNRLRTIAKEE